MNSCKTEFNKPSTDQTTNQRPASEVTKMKPCSFVLDGREVSRYLGTKCRREGDFSSQTPSKRSCPSSSVVPLVKNADSITKQFSSTNINNTPISQYPIPSEVLNKVPAFSCPVKNCKKLFYNACSSQNHLVNFHHKVSFKHTEPTVKDGKEYKSCQYCKKVFDYPVSFNLHLYAYTLVQNIHSILIDQQNRTYFDIAQKTNDNISNSVVFLPLHAKSKLHENYIICKSCNVEFLLATFLTSHIKNCHSKCSFCYTSLNDYNIKTHIISHLQNLKETDCCKICRKQFCIIKDIKIHIERNHKNSVNKNSQKACVQQEICEIPQEKSPIISLDIKFEPKNKKVIRINKPKISEILINSTGIKFEAEESDGVIVSLEEICQSPISSPQMCENSSKIAFQSGGNKVDNIEKNREFLFNEKDSQVYNNYTCKQCSEKFINICSMRLHDLKYHRHLDLKDPKSKINGKITFKCPICLAIFTELKLFHAHCSPYNEFNNSVASGNNQTQVTLLETKEIKMEIVDSPLECGIENCLEINSESTQSGNLLEANSSNFEFVNVKCESTSDDEPNDSIAVQDTPNNVDTIFCCEECIIYFNTYSDFDNHNQIHTISKNIKSTCNFIIPVIQKENDSETKIYCKNCNCDFNYNYYLNVHINSCRFTRVWCPFCVKTFYKSDCFHKHVKSHLKYLNSEYKCPMCSCHFMSKQNLAFHIAMTHKLLKKMSF